MGRRHLEWEGVGMDGSRFDGLVKAWATRGSRRQVLALAGLVAGMAGLRPGRTAAEEAAAGNGGTAGSAANGGVVAVREVSSGGNTGHAIGIDDTTGSATVEGGVAANSTSLDVSAHGGSAIADASGGDENDAFLIGEKRSRPRPPGPTPEPGPGPTPAPTPPPPSPVCVDIGATCPGDCSPGGECPGCCPGVPDATGQCSTISACCIPSGGPCDLPNPGVCCSLTCTALNGCE